MAKALLGEPVELRKLFTAIRYAGAWTLQTHFCQNWQKIDVIYLTKLYLQ